VALPGEEVQLRLRYAVGGAAEQVLGVERIVGSAEYQRGGAHIAETGLGVEGVLNILEARFTIPSLSTIDPGHDFTARTAVQMLVERIEHKTAAGPPREVVAPARLVARESTRSPARGA
jgi:DNA-binding LacI/PurR family transcriptional regulator